MSMITGVGDEVVEVLVLLMVVGVAVLAWWSTAARPDRFRTVIVMERTSRSSQHVTLVGSNITNVRHRFVRNRMQAVPPQQLDNTVTHTDWQEIESSMPETTETSVTTTGDNTETPASSDQAREMDSIVDAMDADMSAIERRALLSAKPARDDLKNNSIAEASQKQDSNGTKPIDTNSARTDRESERIERSGGTQNIDDTDGSNMHKINIKLKYLNDTFREVDGSLHELLKDFKGRHFASELSTQYRVLLIFNGHVLSQDTSTLAACGLYNNCVVHCLVHPPKQPRSPANSAEVVPSLLEAAVGATPGGLQAEAAPAPAPTPATQRVWDLENVLMTLVSLILTVIWFFRCEYSNIFTASASGALFALTIFYSIAIFGLYFSDTFLLTDRRSRNEQAAQRAQVRA